MFTCKSKVVIYGQPEWFMLDGVLTCEGSKAAADASA